MGGGRALSNIKGCHAHMVGRGRIENSGCRLDAPSWCSPVVQPKKGLRARTQLAAGQATILSPRCAASRDCHFMQTFLLSGRTMLVLRMAHRIWKENKQQPGTAGPGNMLGCCLISFHFLWVILSTSTVDANFTQPGNSSFERSCVILKQKYTLHLWSDDGVWSLGSLVFVTLYQGTCIQISEQPIEKKFNLQMKTTL